MSLPVVSVGVDLGTSNSVLAVSVGDLASASEQVIPIPQIESPGRIFSSSVLPSQLYLPLRDESERGDFNLPWDSGAFTGQVVRPVVGTFAKEQSALIPERVVCSAKSWLCCRTVDPRGQILPWRSEIEEGKISPLAASAAYLSHLRQAFQAEFVTEDLNTHSLVLTVPASFDEGARELTREAAKLAGWSQVTLLEEPLAALYAWLVKQQDNWRDSLEPGDLVLVCDVGGGTTDFSLVAVGEYSGDLSGDHSGENSGELRFERLSVGEHILLGGDNMDLAIAHHLRQILEDQGQEITEWQFHALTHASRAAKERILSDGELDSVAVAIAGRGSSMFAKSLSVQLERSVVSSLLLEGYFPSVSRSESEALGSEVTRERASIGLGLQELGLNYASDPAITRHLARFLYRSRITVEGDERLKHFAEKQLAQSSNLLLPTVILFNGGVFHSMIFQNRVLDVCREWMGGEELKALSLEAQLDTAVAFGAAAYGKILKTGKGIRIRAGVAHSYYVGLQRSALAVPGIRPKISALCIAPQGMEEGTEAELAGHTFGAVVGQPVEFRLFHSNTRANTQQGVLVEDAERELTEGQPVSAELDPPEGSKNGDVVPVYLKSHVSEVGELELSLKHQGSSKAWRLTLSQGRKPSLG